MTNSTAVTSNGKAAPKKLAKLKKPRPDFPLGIHRGNGSWCKKVKGRVFYFGKVADDPKGKAALALWLKQKDDLYAGRTPGADKQDPNDLTIVELANAFLTYKEGRRDLGELCPRTFLGHHRTCATLIKVFGREQRVTALQPLDFDRLRTYLAKRQKAVGLANDIVKCRGVFNFALKSNLIDRAVRFGVMFDRPPKKQITKEKRLKEQEHGTRMLEAADIRKILAACNPAMKAMVLLGINAGLGQSDLAALPKSAIDLDGAMLDYPRPKTEAIRLCPLWPETCEAIKLAIAERAKPKDKADATLVFLTMLGTRWVRYGKTGKPQDSLGPEFGKLLVRLELKRRGISFYALRHSFRTIADAVLDDTATNLIMGHADSSMAAHYRERIGVERLQKVTDHVRSWLFAETEGGAK